MTDQADPDDIRATYAPEADDLARGGDGLLRCLQLTSKDHDRDEAQEAAAGRHWMDVGAGGWDHENRPSEVRLDRQVVLRESDVRREGAALDAGIYAEVLAARAALG